MQRRKRTLAWIIVLGGAAVLVSYASILRVDPATRADLWGGVPGDLLPAYVTSMLLATAGFFAYTSFLFIAVDPDRARIAGRYGYGLFIPLYALILFPSALWLPLTSVMIQTPSSALWLSIRLVLAVVGLGSLGILAALLFLRPKQPAKAHGLAVAGALAFSFQTVVLDLVVWTTYFAV